ncbi:reverse transcriptase family protein [Polaribacter sp. Asnod1-A03]|uniref:reverse transcriptase family protein n=1 Tax=Polaribacter sp. Asnod1-A03 TaxID=3160581 RepID=UPI003865937A
MISYSDYDITIYLTLSLTSIKNSMTHQSIKNITQLANYLRCNLTFLENAISKEYNIIESTENNKPSDDYIIKENNEIYIDKFYIKKKGKTAGFRGVHSISDFQLESTLKILNNYLSTIFLAEDCVHGFIKGRSTKTNAKPHLAKNILLSLDIKNYFESISVDMISESLTSLGFQRNIAENISNLVTINGHLVQGFCTSPTIANIVTDSFDKEMIKLCGENVAYTRYADDLSLSSDKYVPEVNVIEDLMLKHGFELNKKKTNKAKRGHYQFVTGLTIFDKKTPRIPKKIKRNIKLEVHCISKLGYKKHAIRRLKNSNVNYDYKSPEFQHEINEEIIKTQHRLFGWIHYIMSVEPIFGKKMYDILIKSKREYITKEMYLRYYNL